MKRHVINDSQVRITAAGLANSSARLVPPGSVLVVTRSGVLKHTLPVALTTAPVAINQDMRALVPQSDLDAGYLLHLLRARTSVVLRWVRATTADNFPFDRLLSLEVPLPPLDEQRRVARMLDTLDATRATRGRVCERLNELRDTTLALLHRGGNVVGAARPLGDLSQVQGGLQISRRRDDYPRRLPYLRVANVHRGRLDLSEIKLLGVTDAEALRCALEVGDLLLVEGHGNPTEIGRAARWDGSVPGCVHQNHLIRVRCRQHVISVYAEAYINSATGRRHLLRAAKTTSGLNTITVSDVRSIPIPMVSLDGQRKFARASEAIGDAERRAVRHLAHLDALFASLQHRAFTGAL